MTANNAIHPTLFYLNTGVICPLALRATIGKVDIDMTS
jgi:hypothetical protein